MEKQQLLISCQHAPLGYRLIKTTSKIRFSPPHCNEFSMRLWLEHRLHWRQLNVCNCLCSTQFTPHTARWHEKKPPQTSVWMRTHLNFITTYEQQCGFMERSDVCATALLLHTNATVPACICITYRFGVLEPHSWILCLTINQVNY